MKIPEIKFRPMTLEENIKTIQWAFFEEDGPFSVRFYTIKYFSELAKIDVSASKKEILDQIEVVITKEYTKNKERIRSEAERYNKIWEKYNDIYLTTLSEYFNVPWPDIDVIDASVGLTPVFPRYLDDFSFSVATGFNDSFLIRNTAHETLHFIWFEKWKKLHPETPRREYDTPYITWEYSEMVTDPVLNNKPFTDVFNGVFYEKGYDSFYQKMDGNELVMDKLRDIFSKKMSVEEKMDTGFDYVKSILNSKKL